MSPLLQPSPNVLTMVDSLMSCLLVWKGTNVSHDESFEDSALKCAFISFLLGEVILNLVFSHFTYFSASVSLRRKG